MILVYNCLNIDELVKEFENKFTRQKLEYAKVKRAEDIRSLNVLRSERDPKVLYNSNEVEKIISPSKLEAMSKTSIIPTNIDFNKKLPVLIENATVTILKDDVMRVKAGGYNEVKVYEDLAKFAKIGLYLD